MTYLTMTVNNKIYTLYYLTNNYNVDYCDCFDDFYFMTGVVDYPPQLGFNYSESAQYYQILWQSFTDDFLIKKSKPLDNNNYDFFIYTSKCKYRALFTRSIPSTNPYHTLDISSDSTNLYIKDHSTNTVLGTLPHDRHIGAIAYDNVDLGDYFKLQAPEAPWQIHAKVSTTNRMTIYIDTSGHMIITDGSTINKEVLQVWFSGLTSMTIRPSNLKLYLDLHYGSLTDIVDLT